MVKVVNDICDAFFNAFEFGAQKNAYQFQLFICFLNVILSLWPIVCYFLLARDVHTVFWLGSIPQFVNLLVPLVLFVLNISVNIFTAVKTSSTTSQITCVMLFCVLGSILVGAGVHVMMQAQSVRVDLDLHCGETILTRKIENTWTNLNSFYEQCGRRGDVRRCRGFRKRFGRNQLVNYLEDLEHSFDCVGFCKFLAKPIFNQESEMGKRCATSLSKHHRQVISLVGVPTVVLGSFMLIIGLMFSGYDHL